MDFWKRSYGISRHVRIETTQEMLEVEASMIDTIQRRRLDRLLRIWKKDIQEAIEVRGLQEGDIHCRQKV